MNNQNKYCFLFAGGGTGGHLFPALSVAIEVRKKMPDSKIVFVGNKNKIEGKVVPKNGFAFESIWIKGFARKLTLSNLLFPIKLFVSLIQSLIICFKYKPNVAIGSGGYVSGPAIWAASKFGAKIVLLEQNSFPGVTSKILEKYAEEIHISFSDSKKYFKNQDKVILSGNPFIVPNQLVAKEEVYERFNLTPNKKTIIAVGGSLGAKTINDGVLKLISLIIKEDLQLIWQCGNIYLNEYSKLLDEALNKLAGMSFLHKNIVILPFIEKMTEVYAIADLVIARSGATTIAELSAFGKASILIPSPNVAENHQYLNAKSISDSNGCVLIKDDEVDKILVSSVETLIKDDVRLNILKSNISTFAKPDAANSISDRIITLAGGVK